MKTTLRTLSALLLVVVTRGAAGASTLVTSPLQVSGPLNGLSCQVLNVGLKPVTIRVRAFDSDGSQVDDSGEFTLPAGQQTGSNFSLAKGVTHCKFEVKGPRGAVRASACVVQQGVGCTAVAEAR